MRYGNETMVDRLNGIAAMIDHGTPSEQLHAAESLRAGIDDAIERKTDSFRDSGDVAGLKLWVGHLAGFCRQVLGYVDERKSATATIRIPAGGDSDAN